MTAVIAFVSQKGGVGKSTLSRGLAAVLAHASVKVRVADLDPGQGTIMEWQKLRMSGSVKPPIDVRAYASFNEAFADVAGDEVLILDTAGGANKTTLDIAKLAHLVVQPTGASLDDLYPSVLLFHELVAAGIPPERLVMALCRVANKKEEDAAREYLARAGYRVLLGSIAERAGYRDAHNRGRAITETERKELNEQADALMFALLSRVAVEVKSLRKKIDEDGKKKERGAR